MAKTYKVITELYAETLESVATGPIWQDFLTTAGRNFRLSFDEQILLFAQKPDATAILPVDCMHDHRKAAMEYTERYRKGAYSVFGTGKTLYRFSDVEQPEQPVKDEELTPELAPGIEEPEVKIIPPMPKNNLSAHRWNLYDCAQRYPMNRG